VVPGTDQDGVNGPRFHGWNGRRSAAAHLAILAIICAAFPVVTASPAAASSPAGVVTEFSSGITASSGVMIPTAGPDGNVWFSEQWGNNVGRITPSGTVTEFSIGTMVLGITTGADGNLWFTSPNATTISRITPSGVVTPYQAGLTSGSAPTFITAGPDGNLWFVEYQSGYVGRINPSTGTITEFSSGITPGIHPGSITSGPDGNLWFTELDANTIGRITPSGVVTEFSAGITGGSMPQVIAAGNDGNLWFTETGTNNIAKITTSGVVTEYAVPTNASQPMAITRGPDGNMWFTEGAADKIGMITPSGSITEYSSGITSGAQPFGITAGPDGEMWFAEYGGARMARITSGDPAGVSLNLAHWSVSNNATSATGVSSTYEIDTETAATIATVTMTVPAGTAGTPTVVTNYGIGAGTVGLAANTLTYTVTSPTWVASRTPILIEIGGLTNTSTPAAFTSDITTIDANPLTIDGPTTTNSITFGDTNTVITVVVAKSLTFTNDTSSFILLMDPALSALADETKDVTLTVRTNASSGYTLQANDTAAGLNTGTDTVARFSNGQTGHAAWGGTVDKYGYKITPTISGTAALTGAMAGGDYAGYSNTPETLVSRTDPTGNTPDQLVVTNRVKIDYAQDAGTYGDTLTYTVTPSY